MNEGASLSGRPCLFRTGEVGIEAFHKRVRPPPSLPGPRVWLSPAPYEGGGGSAQFEGQMSSLAPCSPLGYIGPWARPWPRLPSAPCLRRAASSKGPGLASAGGGWHSIQFQEVCDAHDSPAYVV